MRQNQHTYADKPKRNAGTAITNVSTGILRIKTPPCQYLLTDNGAATFVLTSTPWYSHICTGIGMGCV
eukprot:2168649-Rhodomonas_salina.2